MPLEIPAGFEKYLKVAEGGGSIDAYVCPVEGCKYWHNLSAGSVQTHIQLSKDGNHVKFYKENGAEVDTIRTKLAHLRK